MACCFPHNRVSSTSLHYTVLTTYLYLLNKTKCWLQMIVGIATTKWTIKQFSCLQNASFFFTFKYRQPRAQVQNRLSLMYSGDRGWGRSINILHCFFFILSLLLFQFKLVLLLLLWFVWIYKSCNKHTHKKNNKILWCTTKPSRYVL